MDISEKRAKELANAMLSFNRFSKPESIIIDNCYILVEGYSNLERPDYKNTYKITTVDENLNIFNFNYKKTLGKGVKRFCIWCENNNSCEHNKKYAELIIEKVKKQLQKGK